MRVPQSVAVVFAAAVALMAQLVNATTAAVTRQDFHVKTDDGSGIFVRELRPATIASDREPLILVHGARVPGLGSFDLAVPGGSLAFDLAEQTGRTVYVMDVRGYGGSDRPPAMEQPASANPPQARAFEVSRDIAAVVTDAQRRTHSRSVALLGWLPADDKTTWRDPAVAAAYQKAALESDPSSGTHQPPAFRAPLGAIEDSFYQASGRRLFDASSITAHVLLVRSDRDFWSRPEDVQAFAHDATHAASVRILTLPNATHFVHLDRAEHGRDRLLNEIVAFLADRGLPNQGK